MFPPDTKILLAEDMNSIREILIEALESIGFKNIVSCKDGADAWELIQNTTPAFELIVADLNMPVSSGLDLLTRIRASEVHKHLPFLMISEVCDQKTIMNTIKCGADYYLMKPIQAADLPEKLKIIFNKRIGTQKP